MHTRGERIQEYGVRFSSFSTQQLNLSTPQHFGVSIFIWCRNSAWRSILHVSITVFFTILIHPSLESFNHLLVIVKWRGNQPIVEIYGTVKIPVFDWLVEKPEVIC